MHQADIKHTQASLTRKLHSLYTLNRGKTIDLSFRPPFIKLLEAYGNPHMRLPPTIHVAGTNGKGSIIAILRSILSAAGYKVHVYTSPHLLHFNERIVLAGQTITDNDLEASIDEALHLNAGEDITFFEITTAMAFAAFSRVPADILLLEVGMGGRLDCTNIISKPDVSIINKISKDHSEYLGDTLPEIAQEKAGIIKYKTPCIVGYQAHTTQENTEKTPEDVFVDIAEDKAAPLYRANTDWHCDPEDTHFTFTIQGHCKTYPRPNLIGDHQIENAGAALAALHVLREKTPVPAHAITLGLENINWPGRLEHIQRGAQFATLPEGWQLWYDGGHNDSAAHALKAQIQSWQDTQALPLHLIIGMKADKDANAFLKPLLPLAHTLSLIALDGVGAHLTTDHIEPLLKGHNITLTGQHKHLSAAIEAIKKHAPDQKKNRILLCGSLYLAEQCR